jgi:hypothetical protein
MMVKTEGDNIRFIRLDTGENLITRVTTDDKNGIYAYFPLLVLIDIDDVGRPVMQLIEWIPVSLVEERTCQIDKKRIVLNLTPTFFMQKTYNEFVVKLEKTTGNMSTIDQQQSTQDSYREIEEFLSGLLNKKTIH